MNLEPENLTCRILGLGYRCRCASQLARVPTDYELLDDDLPEAIDSTEGFTFLIAALKVFLEHTLFARYSGPLPKIGLIGHPLFIQAL